MPADCGGQKHDIHLTLQAKPRMQCDYQGSLHCVHTFYTMPCLLVHPRPRPTSQLPSLFAFGNGAMSVQKYVYDISIQYMHEWQNPNTHRVTPRTSGQYIISNLIYCNQRRLGSSSSNSSYINIDVFAVRVRNKSMEKIRDPAGIRNQNLLNTSQTLWQRSGRQAT